MDAAAVKDFSILVIDDDPSVREMLADYLVEEGYKTRSESTGEAGIVALSREPHDLVITDLKMPGMSGLDVLRRVKEKRPDCEVIVITGYATIQEGVEAMREGAYDFLLKPIKIDQINAVLARCGEWIRHKRSHAELQEVNRRLLELSRMKEKFLIVTDHELRTPVTAIDGMLHLLVNRAKDLPEDFRTRLEAVSQVSRRLVELVRGIHDLAQSRSQQFPVSLDWATVEDVAQGVRLDFEIARHSRSIDLGLVQDVAGDMPVWIDAHHFRQAVTELVQNAVKATADGGRVVVRLFGQETGGGRRLCVAVSDTGVGIPEQEQGRIFDVFYEIGDERHHHTSKHDFRGSGLGIGLSIALEIARAHGGGIDLRSRPGEGSVFTLWVPAPLQAGRRES